MNRRKHIQEELRELNSILPYDVKEPVFSVPNNYFENFAASVLQRIKEEEALSAADELASLSPTLAGLSKKMPFTLPENYFSALENDVPAIISDDAVPAFLAGHDKNIPYEIPVGYFESLPEQVLSKVAPKQAKVISLNRTRWMRIAAAAMITGLVAISGFFYFNSNKNAAPVNQTEAWVAKNMEHVSNQDIEQFIETTTANTGKDVARSSKAEAKNMLTDVSVKEIDAFLSQVPEEELLNMN